MTRHIIPISGKDSLCAALIQTARRDDLPYEFVFCDVGSELPETYAWLDMVERATGWTINRVGISLEDLIHKRGFLPSPTHRYCTTESKIAPLRQFYGKGETLVYYGLRADENRPGVRPSDLSVPVYPLVECGIDLRGVWTILARKNLLPPSYFWPTLYYRVRELLGIQSNLVDQLEKWVHMGRVNSKRRILQARFFGCNSVDGNYLKFAPDKNIKNLEKWLDFIKSQPVLNC